MVSIQVDTVHPGVLEGSAVKSKIVSRRFSEGTYGEHWRGRVDFLNLPGRPLPA
jgi:hypothetical protein